MNKNKGFIGIGLILAIILGITVVGGGAYYFEKSSPKQKENNIQINSNEINQVDSTASIKVLTPNGGEIYNDTDKIAITWSGVVKDNIAIYLRFSDGGWCFIKDIPSSTTSYLFTPNGHSCTNGRILSSGQYKVTLIAYKNDGMAPEPGTAFAGDYNDNNGSDNGFDIDSSDNYFTIDSPKVSTTNWNTYNDTDYNFSFQYPDTWSLYYGPDNITNLKGEIVSREINFINTADKNATEGLGSGFRTTLLLKYNLPPNGTELYNYAVSEFNSKNGWYKTGSKEIQVVGSKATEAFTTMNVDGKGKKIDPALRLVIVDFLDKQKTGSIQLQFKTPLPNEGAELSNFEKLLTTFKFTNSDLQLTKNDNGKILNSATGQVISVTLCNPGDGGAQFDAPNYDSSILNLVSHTNVPVDKIDKSYPPATGGCYGNDVFKFQTLKVGTSKLNITASQLWNGGEKLVPIFSATILVK